MPSFTEIQRNLDHKIYSPVYFFHGEEPWYIDQLTAAIEKGILDESLRDFNQTILYGHDVTARDVVDYARQFPMMGDHQVIVVKEAQEIRDWTELEQYISNPQPSTILALAHKHKKLDKRKAIYKKLSGSKEVTLFESEKIRDDKVPDFIRTLFKDHGYGISPGALHIMSEYLGNDLGKINNEFQKLQISIPAGTEINEDHVEQNIGISKDFNIFELQKALVQRDALKAQRIINYFESNPKEHPIQLLTVMLHNYFIKIFLMSFQTGKQNREIASEVGISPYFVPEYQAAARVFPAGKTRKLLSEIRRLDMRSKGLGGNASSDYSDLRVLVFRMLN